MRLSEIKETKLTKDEFRQRLIDPRHKLIQDRLENLERVLADYGWELKWEREPGDFLSYTVTMDAGMKPEQIAFREKFQVNAAKVRITIKNAFWEPGPSADREIPDIVVRIADETPLKVEAWVMHDEEADE